jgi:hypothetical protein
MFNFFLSYFVNSQIWLNQVMDEGISTTSHYGIKNLKNLNIALGHENEMTVFDWPIIMNSPRIDIKIVSHFTMSTLSCLWVGMDE